MGPEDFSECLEEDWPEDRLADDLEELLDESFDETEDRNDARTRARMISDLHRLAQAIGHAPSSTDITVANKRGRCAAVPIYRKVFGSIAEARKAAGLDANRPAPPAGEKPPKRSRARMIRELKQLGSKLGRTPSGTDITAAHAAGECATLDQYREMFRTLSQAQKAAGFKPRGGADVQGGRGPMIAALKSLAAELGRTPSQADIDRACKLGKCKHSRTYHLTFGSLRDAQAAAGLKPNEVGSRKV